MFNWAIARKVPPLSLSLSLAISCTMRTLTCTFGRKASNNLFCLRFWRSRWAHRQGIGGAGYGQASAGPLVRCDSALVRPVGFVIVMVVLVVSMEVGWGPVRLGNEVLQRCDMATESEQHIDVTPMERHFETMNESSPGFVGGEGDPRQDHSLSWQRRRSRRQHATRRALCAFAHGRSDHHRGRRVLGAA